MKSIEVIDKIRIVARAIENLLSELTTEESEDAIAMFDIAASGHGGPEDAVAAEKFKRTGMPIRNILFAILEFRKVILGNFGRLDDLNETS